MKKTTNLQKHNATRKAVLAYATSLQSRRNLFVKEMITPVMRKFRLSHYSASLHLGLID